MRQVELRIRQDMSWVDTIRQFGDEQLRPPLVRVFARQWRHQFEPDGRLRADHFSLALKNEPWHANGPRDICEGWGGLG